MAWIQYFRISGGELAGKALSGDGSFNNVTWNVAPDPNSNVFKYIQGVPGRVWDGVSCKGIFQQMNVGDQKMLWVVNVKQDSYYDEQIYLQIRCIAKDAYASSFEFKLMKRVWSSDSSFTDTNITNVLVGSITFYFGSPYVLTDIVNTTGFVTTYNNTKYLYFGFAWLDTRVATGTAERHVLGYAIPYNKINDLLDGEIPSEEGSPEFGPASEPGGGYIPGGGGTPIDPSDIKIPTFDNTSDTIELPTKPTLDALGSKFFHAYKVTEASMFYIADALFPQPVWTQNDIIMMLGEIGQMLFFNKQIDYMLDCLILPIDVPAGDWEAVKVGGHTLKTVIEGTTYTINGMPVDDCYVDFTCGSLSIDEYWVNFLDFAGTKVKLFLPYVGYVDIQPEYIIGGTLYVDYRFNVVDGSFMCYVRSDSGYSQLEESMIGQYAGVAAVHIPLQAQDYSNKVSGLISAIGSVAAGAASGGIGAAAAVGAGANAANTLVQKPGSSHSNGYNASSSFLSNKTPYLIIERQWAQFSEKYPEEIGIPSNVTCRIGDLSGLVKSANAHLDTIPANSEIKERISGLLADGIIV